MGRYYKSLAPTQKKCTRVVSERIVMFDVLELAILLLSI